MTTAIFSAGRSVLCAPIEKLMSNLELSIISASVASEVDNSITSESIGMLIVRALKSDIQWRHICECWEVTFSEPVCPICASLNSPMTEFAEEICEKMMSMLQGSPKLPSCIKTGNLLDQLNPVIYAKNAWPHSNDGSLSVLAAWVRRNLLRTRGDISSDQSRCISVPSSSGTIVDVHFPFDFHCVRHIFNGSGNMLSSLSSAAVLEPRGGKSNSKFIVTDDGQYIIKSINAKEEEFLLEFAPAFFWYYSKAIFQGMPTLLVPLLGMFTIRNTKGDSRSSFIVLHNLSPDPTSLLLDLKGAGSSRSIDPNSGGMHVNSTKLVLESGPASIKPPSDDIPSDELNLSGQAPMSPTSGKEVLWDEDFRKLLDSDKILLPNENHQYLTDAISNDTEFLSAMNVVDYSLFIAFQREQDSDGRCVLYAGIIDFLRPYTWDKKLESVVKTVNANIANIGSRMSVIAGATEPDTRSMPIPDMDKAPTIIKPELYARRFRSNIGMLFSASDEKDSIVD